MAIFPDNHLLSNTITTVLFQCHSRWVRTGHDWTH